MKDAILFELDDSLILYALSESTNMVRNLMFWEFLGSSVFPTTVLPSVPLLNRLFLKCPISERPKNPQNQKEGQEKLRVATPPPAHEGIAV